MSRNGSVPFTPASTGGFLQTGSTSPAHPVAAGIIKDDQVDAAGFLAFGGEPGSGAATDDRFAARDHGAEFLQKLGAFKSRHRSPCHPPARARASDQGAERA